MMGLKELLQFKWIIFRFFPQYSSIPVFHSSIQMAQTGCR